MTRYIYHILLQVDLGHILYVNMFYTNTSLNEDDKTLNLANILHGTLHTYGEYICSHVILPATVY